MECTYRNDIDLGEDAIAGSQLEENRNRYDAIITNPPWGRKLLHPMIDKFVSIAPTYLLFDGNWVFTKQAAPFLDRCVKVIPVGRLIWIPGTKMSGKDDVCWYYFHPEHEGGPRLYPR